MPDVLFMNPRKRRGRPKKKQRAKRKSIPQVKVSINPKKKKRRRRRYTSNFLGGNMQRSITNAIVPVGVGIAAGLATPKIFKLTGMQRYIAPIAIGAGASFILGPIMGRKASNYLAIGALSSVVLMFINDTLLKTGQTGSVLAQEWDEDEEEEDIELISQDETIPELTKDEEEEEEGLPGYADDDELRDAEMVSMADAELVGDIPDKII